MPLWYCADFSLYIVYLASNEYSQAARANSFDRESLSHSPSTQPFLGWYLTKCMFAHKLDIHIQSECIYIAHIIMIAYSD